MAEDKRVDRDWKRQVEAEKERLASDAGGAGGGGPQPMPGPPERVDLLEFLNDLGLQAMVFLGAIPNPLTGKHEVDPDWAKFKIDTLQMLADRMKGNLTPEEDRAIRGLLYDLRLRYVSSV